MFLFHDFGIVMWYVCWHRHREATLEKNNGRDKKKEKSEGKPFFFLSLLGRLWRRRIVLHMLCDWQSLADIVSANEFRLKRIVIHLILAHYCTIPVKRFSITKIRYISRTRSGGQNLKIVGIAKI